MYFCPKIVSGQTPDANPEGLPADETFNWFTFNAKFEAGAIS
jgi:hypothetical protein